MTMTFEVLHTLSGVTSVSILRADRALSGPVIYTFPFNMYDIQATQHSQHRLAQPITIYASQNTTTRLSIDNHHRRSREWPLRYGTARARLSQWCTSSSSQSFRVHTCASTHNRWRTDRSVLQMWSIQVASSDFPNGAIRGQLEHQVCRHTRCCDCHVVPSSDNRYHLPMSRIDSMLA